MSRARLDLEKDKFDSEGRVKVSIEQNNAASEDQDVVVKNTSSEPVPVSIINPSDAIDLQVEIQPNITIDDSTPIDVNVTNTVATNATIQNANIDVNLTDLNGSNRLPVSVDNQPTVTVDDSTPIDVNVTNTVATNATIQNTELDVNVTNAFQYIYAMVYDGSQWRFQLSDTNGKTISLDRTYYTSSDITTMSSSSDINVWLAAYNDNMLTKKYVESYDDEFEQDVYLQHPDLSSGNCLQLIYQYSTENSQKVVKSVWAKIATWTFNDDITGTVSISAGTVTSPDPSSAISVGTDICTLTVTETVIGDLTVSLTGTNASLYRLSDGVNTGSSIAYNASNTPLVVETASDFSGANYSHSLSAVITSDKFGITDTVNITTSGTYTEPSGFSNLKFLNMPSSTTANADFELTSTGSVLTPWPSLGSTTNYFPQNSEAWSLSCWVKGTNNTSNYLNIFSVLNTNSAQIKLFMNTGALRFSVNRDANAGQMYFTTTGSSVLDGTWNNIIITKASSTNIPLSAFTLYINGTEITTYSSSGDTYGTSTSHETRSVSAVELGGALRSAVTGNYLTRSAIDLSCDEFIFFNKELSTDNGGVNEITELYNNGSIINPSDLTFSANVDSYFRMGDNTNDSVANVTFVDNEDTVREFQTKHTGSQAIKTLNINDATYAPGSEDWSNNYYARSNTTNSSVVDFRLNGTEKSLWPSLSTGTNTFPPTTTAWSMSFWIYMPTTGTGLSNTYRECLIKQQVGTAQGGIQVFMRGTNTMECYFGGTTANNYFYTAIGTGFSYDAWNLITVNYNGGYRLRMFANDSSATGTYSTTGSTATINTEISNATINATEVMSFVYTPAGGASRSRANRFYRIDELITYNREITQTEREELYNAGGILNPDDLSFASTIESYFRFGDGTNDNTTNYYAYDDNDSTRYFEPITAGTRDFTTH